MKAGLLFPSAGFKRLPTRDPTATPGHRRLMKFFKDPERNVHRREAQALLQEMTAADGADLILSCEVFSVPHKHRLVAGVKWFQERGFTVKLIAYLRRQDRCLDSLYRERLKSDGPSGWETRSIEEFWLAEGDAWLDYRSRLGPWVEAVGRSNAIIRSYEDAQQRQGVIRDFLAIIGVDESLMDLSQASAIHNPSVPPAAANFLRAYNADKSSRWMRKAPVIASVCKMELFNRARGSLVSAALWSELKAAYSEQVEELRQSWVTGPSELLSFNAATPDTPIEQAMTYPDAELLLKALIQVPPVIPGTQDDPLKPPPAADLGSFGTITTCRENPAQVREFVNYHLNLGAAAMVIYFDDPRDPAIKQFEGEPRVICRPCDDIHWRRLLGRPPKSFAEAQVKNLEEGSAILRKRGVAWIASIDIDELLYSRVPLCSLLSEVDEDVDIILAKPREAIQHERMSEEFQFRSSYFREFTPQFSPTQQETSMRFMPAVLEFGDSGCFAHRDGKTLFRATSEIETYGVHLPKNKSKPLRMVGSEDIVLLHFDANSYETWERRWIARVTGQRVQSTKSVHRRKQHDHLAHVLASHGRAGLKRVFEDWHFYSPKAIAALEAAGLVRQIRIPGPWFEGPVTEPPAATAGPGRSPLALTE